ncbi:hypothetical protein Pmi06nite_06310 [Planotetraspora mira]|uniref:Uncharacterized protein n=1 Tax=Planotetraspora mira TaxID=58121 RepID=A0A8J3TJA3_9ACTN|nr:hypothetical protein Pmi06nite_06310 [Planotetraspora mira]
MEEVRNTSSVWYSGCLVGGLVGVPTTLITIFVIGHMWSSCNVGVNAGANSLTLILFAPIIWLASALSWLILYGAIGRFNHGVAIMFGIVFNLGLLWFLVAHFGAMESYPDPICPGNVPPWWPSFIPV